ncbi:MAG: hypothetical protein FGM63_04690 [Candidatus Nanopelagicaceae bacterium]|nr:hypothetical protein [Candidatus Nanopelagicaceae bacterium]
MSSNTSLEKQPTEEAPLRKSPNSLLQRVKSLASITFEHLANLAIYLDMIIRESGKRTLNLIPMRARKKLIALNEKYKLHRNKLLGINETPSCSCTNSNSAAICELETERSLQRGDVPGWVLVVLMTTGLVTALWTIAAPRLSQILKNSLDSMNSIR